MHVKLVLLTIGLTGCSSTIGSPATENVNYPMKAPDLERISPWDTKHSAYFRDNVSRQCFLITIGSTSAATATIPCESIPFAESVED